ncbi:amidase [Acinetobacter sp. WU_MDCI_Axc73]|nr:amidase [Acinetobacter sp. WU_MDCI_Axc73]
MTHHSYLLKRFSLPFFILTGFISGCNDSDDNSQSNNHVTPQPYQFVEGTIEQMQTSIKTGGITCHQVVQGYINRINTYDKQGVTLNSVITVSETALTEADKLDAYFKQNGKLIGPMHCVTVLPKDNIDTFDMPTSAGSKALMYSQPEQDAYIIKKIRDAGGIIIGKANLDEFAFGFQGNGTHPRGGQVKNAYDLSKGPGGSSSGTGASISASFAQVGIGTDTGGSVRVPSSVEGLFGLRPSLRLVSQSGIIPLAPFQDTAGPMCRAVQDCAILMDQMTGYDASLFSNQRSNMDINAPLLNGSIAYQTMTNVPTSYTASLNKDALKEAHIGVVRALFGSNNSTETQLVNNTIDNAISQLKAAGATVDDVDIDDLNAILTSYRSVSAFEFKTSLTKYLQSWSNVKDHHYLSYDEILASGEARSNFNAYNIDLSAENIMAEYKKNTEERPNFVRTRLNNALDNKTLDGVTKGAAYDVLLYPTIQGLPSVLGGSPTTGTNNRLSPFSGFPAMNLPAGMVTTSPSLPRVPVGMEILGREFAEPTLFKIAYAWQQYAQPRQAPLNTPELKKVN